jgi:hypothetical protein
MIVVSPWDRKPTGPNIVTIQLARSIRTSIACEWLNIATSKWRENFGNGDNAELAVSITFGLSKTTSKGTPLPGSVMPFIPRDTTLKNDIVAPRPKVNTLGARNCNVRCPDLVSVH